jgi:putative ABC transport system ATP-binding protein
MFHLSGVRYKGILDIQELRLQPLATTCIVGESGSGKSTLLRLLNNLISPDEGTILFKGTDISAYDPIKLRQTVTMLPQTPLMFPGDIKDNLLLGLSYAGGRLPSDDVLQGLLEQLHLHLTIDGPVDKLSGGEKQRVALARLLLMEPEILLLDEPTSALDEQTAGSTMGYVKDLCAKKQWTLIMVTHSMELARNVADEVVVMEAGRIKEIY